MIQSVINTIRKNKIIVAVFRFLFSAVSSRKFPFYLFIDPQQILNKYYHNVKMTQLNKTLPLFIDRQNEINEFFNLSIFSLLNIYRKYGLPGSEKFKKEYLRSFEGNVSPDKLKKAYDNVELLYSIRLMMAYERYSFILEYLDFLETDYGKRFHDFSVLDYGCGVADISLLLASLGAHITVCDLHNKKLDFVMWRFKKRGFI